MNCMSVKCSQLLSGPKGERTLCIIAETGQWKTSQQATALSAVQLLQQSDMPDRTSLTPLSSVLTGLHCYHQVYGAWHMDD